MNLDQLGHETYEYGTQIYDALVKKYGTQILDPYDKIDRNSLGNIVFSDQKHLVELEELVLPAIKVLLDNRINDAFISDPSLRLIVVEGATIVKSREFFDEFDEIWSCLVEVGTAYDRLINLRTVDPEKASRMLSRNCSNKEFFLKSHVIFSSDFSEPEMMLQVDRAMNRLIDEDFYTNL